MVKKLRAVISFGLFCLVAFAIFHSVAIGFSLGEKYPSHFGLVVSTAIAIILFKLVKVKISLKGTLIYLLLIESAIFVLSPLDSLIPEKLLVQSRILKGIDELPECNFKHQLDLASDFMKDEVDLSKLKIYYGGSADIDWPFLSDIKGAAWSNHIYISRKEPCITDYTLVHELTHVWQYQQGYGYGPKWVYLWPYYYWKYLTDFHALYDFGSFAGLEQAASEGKRFTDFNHEQQAEIVANYYFLTSRPFMSTTERLKTLKYFISQEFNF